MLCQYKDIFGKPGEGVHGYRICDIAIVDLFLTIFVSIIFAYIFNKSFLGSFLFLFVLSILMHILFCVDTTVIKTLHHFL